MDHSSGGKAGSGIRVRLFQSSGSVGSSTAAGAQLPKPNTLASILGNDSEISNIGEPTLLSDDEIMLEDGRHMSTADGGDSSLVPIAAVHVPVDSTSNQDSVFNAADEQLSEEVVEMAENCPGNDNSGIDINFKSSNGASAFCRSSPGGFADERDPNYATQRPDTLGAITIAEASQGNVIGSMQARFGGAPVTLRPWVADSAVEGASFADNSASGLRLGRRTCGAGMDQIELNQRGLPDDDDDDDDDDNDVNLSENGNEGSDDGNTVSDVGDEDDDDNRLVDANQCESTEADQYKMEPEVDQSDSGDIAARACHSSVGVRQDSVAAPPLLVAPRVLQDHHLRLDRFNCDAFNGDAGADLHDFSDIDKAEEDQAPIVRHFSGNGHSSGPMHMPSSLGNGPSTSGPEGTGRLSAMMPHAVAKSGATGMKKTKAGHVNNFKSGADSVVSSAFKPVNSVRTTATEVPSSAAQNVGLSSKTSGKQTTYCASGKVQSASGTSSSSAMHQHGKSIPLPSAKVNNELLLSAGPAVASSNPEFYMDNIINMSDRDQVSQNVRIPRRDGMLPVGADVGQVSQGVIVSREHQDHFRFEGLAAEGHSPTCSLTRTTPARGNSVLTAAADYPIAAPSFVPGDSSSQQTTPVRVYARLPQQLLDDSLEMSPIRPASSVGSQYMSHHAPDSISARGDMLGAMEFMPVLNYEDQVQNEQTMCEINGMEGVRGQLGQLLLLSERNISDKASYDHTRDEVEDLLTCRSSGRLSDPAMHGLSNLAALHDALPLSSKYLMPSAPSGYPKPDPATLQAENHALRDALDQQRFKLRHCEKQIQLLQNKILELQQNLSVAVSTDRKKDIMIEHLDKALFKLVEGWKQKEADRSELVHRLQLEKSTLKQALDSQQQVVSRFERQLKQTLGQLHAEQQRTTSICSQKDDQLDELRKECERVQQDLNMEKEQCRRLIEAEKREMMATRDKMQAQIAQLKASHEENRSMWHSKEQEYLEKVDDLTDSHMKSLECHRIQVEKQKQLYGELQSALKTSQMKCEKLQLELDTTMRERECLKVELSLSEAQMESAKRKLEAELLAEAERQMSARLDDLAQRQVDSERKIHETHKKHLQDLALQHRTEMQHLSEEHEEALRWLEEKHLHEDRQQEDRIQELEREVCALEADNKKMQARNVEVTCQLQSMMQSHCSEALRLLQHANSLVPSSNEISTLQKAGDRSPLIANNNGEKAVLSLPLPVETVTAPNSVVVKSGRDGQEGSVVCRSHAAEPSSFSPPVSISSTQSSALCSASSHLSTQYSQFLESVRGFQPLLADLNASIASVTNSVSTVSANVCAGQAPLDEAAPSVQSNEAAGMVDPGSGVWLHSPVVQRSVAASGAQQTCNHHEDLPSMRGSQGGSAGNPRNGALLSHILQQDFNGLNSTCSSVEAERIGSNSSMVDSSRLSASSSDRVRHHEMRQQELNHYIRVLLQKSPGSTEVEDCPVSDAVVTGRETNAPNGVRNQKTEQTSDSTNFDPQMKLTSQQLSEIARMLQLHRATAPVTNGDNLDSAMPLSRSKEQTNPRCSSPTKGVRHDRHNVMVDGQLRHQQVGFIENVAKSNPKLCKQSGPSAPSNGFGVGPGRPDIHADPSSADVRPLKQDAAARSLKPSTIDGVSAKRQEKKGQAYVANGSRNSNKQTSVVWK